MGTSQKSFDRRVMIAVDGSPASLEALRQGYRMALLIDAPVVAVNTWHIAYGLYPPATWNPAKDSQQLLTDSIREAFHPASPPAIETVTVEGDAAGSLLRLSKNAELLVIGSRGHSGLAGVMLGSVSAVCAAHATCPVLVVHAPQEQELPVKTVASEPHTNGADHLVTT